MGCGIGLYLRRQIEIVADVYISSVMSQVLCKLIYVKYG